MDLQRKLLFSFQLKAPSFEDSQVDQYQAYASPYALYWPANKKLLGELSTYDLGCSSTSAANLSDVERKRGVASPSNDTVAPLIQLPITGNHLRCFKLKKVLKYVIFNLDSTQMDASLRKRLSVLDKYDKLSESRSSSSLNSNQILKLMDDSKLTSLTKLDANSGLSSELSRTKRWEFH